MNPSLTAGQRRPLSNAQLLMMIALASWSMLFGTFVLSLGFARVRAVTWPPLNIPPLDAKLPTIATAALLLSSFLIHKGYKTYQSQQENIKNFRFYWGMGALLGIFFVGLQSYSLWYWYESGVRVSTHLYSSAVYVWILMHGAHMLAALAGISYKFFSPKNQDSLQLWSWFWHFIDVVWLVMFPLLVF